jgi:DNA (cytosine-5)-methyltransferase 1
VTAYYNEIDPYAAQWLRNLIAAGHIVSGVVDERSILDVAPDDLRGFAQCHFFAGIGAWSYALRLAGWPDDRPVWTGSCPCQPFSVAGMGGGFDDERHLWPFWFHLIENCFPPVVFGEQVEAAIRHGWLDLVQADLEGIGYAFGAVGFSAAGVGAPHIRQRLWFVADHHGNGRQSRREGLSTMGHGTPLESDRGTGGMGNSNSKRLEGLRRGHQTKSGWDGAIRSVADAGELGGVEYCTCNGWEQWRPGSNGRCLVCGCRFVGMADARGEHGGCQEHAPDYRSPEAERPADQSGGCRGAFGGLDNPERTGRETRGDDDAEHDRIILDATGDADRNSGALHNHWRDADWLYCRDGKWRPVEPGTFPLAHGAAARVGRLRAYGNAIIPQVAAQVIGAYMDCRP